jgi:CubicO group peptidase (beta-lactamase class C family)
MKTFARYTLTTAVTLLATFGLSRAQAVESVTETRAVGFVKTMQAGDADALLQYMHENWIEEEPGDNRAERWPRVAQSLTERHAEAQVVGVTIDRPNEVSVITEEADGMQIRFIFEFEPTAPHRIVSMGVEAGRGMPDVDFPPLDLIPGATTSAIASALQDWFDALEREDLFSGTALVAWQGEPIFRGAWGHASKRWDVPNELKTRFDLGSINKSFTKIAVGQLMLAGQLSLDDTMAKHLPDYPNQETAAKITVRHLLEHSAGLGDIFSEEFFHSSKALYRTPSDFFPLFADRPLDFEPGTGQSYSNAGFMVLGAIVEAVSGQPFDEYVIEHIFKPAGMENSGFFAHDELDPDVAEGYTRHGADGEMGDQWRSNMFMLPVKGNSAGSAYATVEDLLNFDNALREFRLLPYGYTQWYFEMGAPDPNADSKKPKGRARAEVGIAGGAPGVSASLESNADLAVIILSNYDAPITEQITRHLYRPLKDVLKEAR